MNKPLILLHELAQRHSSLSVEVEAQKFSSPELIFFNEDLAQQLGMDLTRPPLNSEQQRALIFSGQQRLDQNCPPRAFAYAGHQFGHFNPQLGDGRAMLLGELKVEGKNFDIQLKGMGRTPFSRRGDGLSAMGPVIREVILCEAMYALGVPTTRALAAVATGEQVYRQETGPGAVFTRVAKSHLRVGSFEYFAARSEWSVVEELMQVAIERYYPEAKNSPNPALSFLELFAERFLTLVAQWMSLGFIHGVMNTDNTSITCETIDYGPCAFLDEYLADKVFSSIDRDGRYRYSNQGQIALWNISALAQCLIPFIDPDQETAVSKLKDLFGKLTKQFDTLRLEAMGRKFGLNSPDKDDKKMIESFLVFLEKEKRDFTLSFTELNTYMKEKATTQMNFSQEFSAWFEDKRNRNEIDFELMKKSNPMIIPRNHQVEHAIERANVGDYSYLFRVREALKNPFELNQDSAFMQVAPELNERVKQTFCGT